MRDAFAKSILELARNEKRIFLLVADIGTYLFRDFKRDFPERFVNVGIAEANMIGVAAGLAMTGKIPFVYTITPFATFRCLDQIRVDVCYQRLNVRIVGVGSGISYGTAGPTHHSLEDMAVMRVLPNMTVLSPSDPVEVGKMVEKTAEYVGPLYIRLPLAGDPIIHEKDYDFQIGKGELLRDGDELTIIATGVSVFQALKIASELEKIDVSCRVINIHTIKPIDKTMIQESAKKTQLIVTLEEHSIIGGLGNAVAEVLAEGENRTPLKRIGFEDTFCLDYGDKEHLYRKYQLSGKDLWKKII